MNIQTRLMNKRTTKKRKSTIKKVNPFIVLAWVFLAAIPILILFSAFMGRVYMNEKSSISRKKISGIKNSIHTISREIEQLKMQKEELKGYENIYSRISEMNLSLRPAESQQLVFKHVSKNKYLAQKNKEKLKKLTRVKIKREN